MSVRWGIAGPGAMAVGFANDLALVDDAELVAVGSRSIDRAEAFGERFDLPNVHGSYEDLAADPAVDIVYVATPQSSHERDTMLFLEAGKHVLCEKPFALNAAQGSRMIDAARQPGLFLMEAMWARFLPPYRTLMELLTEGAIGEPRLVEADFGYVMPRDPEHRLWDPHRGGGGLLDMPLTCTARIAGTLGIIELPAFMHCPGSLTVTRPGSREVIETPWPGGGWQFQVEEVHRCLAAGELESPIMPHAETVSILRTLDAIRDQIGLRFPDE